MPMYIFSNPKTKEVKEVFFHMEDDKKYIDEDGLEWNRELSSPQLNTQGGIDPWSNSDFVNKTADSKGTLGDLMDRSKELSDQRAKEHGGVDPLKKKYYENYSKERKGAKHLDEVKKTYENKNVKIEF